MVDKRVHTTKGHYRFRGEESGEHLAAWLNGEWNRFKGPVPSWMRAHYRRVARKDSKARERIIDLLSILQEMEEAFERVRTAPAQPAQKRHFSRLRILGIKARTILKRYKSYPTVHPNVRKGEDKKRNFSERAFAWGIEPADTSPMGFDEFAVNHLIPRLVSLQALKNVKRCAECQRFFFARHNAVLCPKCRAHLYTTSYYKGNRVKRQNEAEAKRGNHEHKI